MIQVPGQKPHIPPSVTPKEVSKEANKSDNQASKPARPVTQASATSIGRGPELDSRAISVRLAALATEAKKKEISGEEFERILEEVITLTGLKDPEAAMEEASRRLQKEIEMELEKIKSNKGLMEEAQDWEKFAGLLERMGAEQAEAMLAMLKQSIRDLH